MKLLMSLLFLTNILDPFQALDDSGRPLPFAVLTFWESGTTAPQAVYSDQELLEVLSDEKGRVTAGSLGVFPLIYLDETALYRVRLQTAQGVLRFDVDPYICDCTEPPRLFRGPVHQALARVLDDPPTFAPPPQSGARLRFTLTETEEPRDTWADAARTIPHPNPLRANAGGFFPPVYLDDVTEYRVRLDTAAGAPLLDVDPYECQCGFLLLTSRPYALESLDAAESNLASAREGAAFGFVEGAETGSSAISGSLVTAFISYGNYAPEAGESRTVGALSGTLIQPLETYSNYAPEAGESQLVGALSGTIDVVLVTYGNYAPEAGESGLTSAISGTLV
jgi:hypothetical protein